MKRRRPKRNIVMALATMGVGLAALIGLIYFRPVTPKQTIASQPAVKSRMILPQTQPRSDNKKVPSSQSSPNGYRLPVPAPPGSALRQGQIPIIMYHYIRVNDPEDENGVSLSVSPTHFAQQLDDLQKRGYQTVTFKDLASGHLPAKPVILTFDDGYEDFFTTAYPELVKHKMTAVIYVIANFQKSEYLTPNQILYLASHGIEIGSHTLDHVSLTKTTGWDTVRQLSGSKQLLEQMTGRSVVSIAYPFGSYNTDIEHAATQAGYQYAVTTVGGLADLKNPMELMRFRAKDTPELDFGKITLDSTSPVRR